MTYEDALIWFTPPLFIAAFLAMAWIVRDVWPSLNEPERMRFKKWFSSSGPSPFGGELNRAWREHYRLFPGSLKRLLFASLLIALASPQI